MFLFFTKIMIIFVNMKQYDLDWSGGGSWDFDGPTVRCHECGTDINLSREKSYKKTIGDKTLTEKIGIFLKMKSVRTVDVCTNCHRDSILDKLI